MARKAGVSWPTARRHLGSREQLRELLAREQAGSEPQNPDTRTRILDAAARVFARHGFAGATLDQVAADAGMTKGAVYWHFASKADLYLALMAERVRHQMDGLPTQVQRVAGMANPEEGLATLLAGILSECVANPEQPRLFLEFVAHSREPQIQERLGQIYQAAYRESEQLIAGLQQAGLVAAEADPGALAVLFSAILDGLVLTALVSPDRIHIETITPQVARILWRGLSPRSD